MVMQMSSLLNFKANIVGTAFVAILSTSITILAYEIIIKDEVGVSLPLTEASKPALGTTVLDCDEGLYSPIQKTCVSQTVFDLEMKKLFTALGIDASPYQSSQ